MNYSAGFVPYLLKAQHAIAADLGVDIMTADLSTYRINLTQLSLVAMVMKAIQDLHPTIATDAVMSPAPSSRGPVSSSPSHATALSSPNAGIRLMITAAVPASTTPIAQL